MTKTGILYGWILCKNGGCKLQLGKDCKSKYVVGRVNEWAYSPTLIPTSNMVGRTVVLIIENYRVTDITFTGKEVHG